MTWTTELPKEDGYYWARMKEGDPGIIVEKRGDKIARFMSPCLEHMKAWLDCEWWGPIPRPE